MLKPVQLLLGLTLAFFAPALPGIESARAQEGRDAIQLFNMASDLAEKGRYEEAIKIWADIAEELPAKYLAVVQFNLGVAYKQMERLPEAWHHLSLARKLAKHGSDTAESAAAGMKEVTTELIGTHVKVLIFTRPDGGTIYFGETASGLGYPSPVTWWLEPAGYKVYAVNPEHKPKLVDFEVKHGTNPYHSVMIEMEPIGQDDGGIVKPATGTGKLGVAGWALVGGGAAVALVGGIVNMAANARNEELYEKYTGDEFAGMSGTERQALYDQEYDSDVQSKRIAGYVLYGVGGAAAVAGGVLLILNKKKGNAASGVSVAPMMGPDSTGAMLSVEW